MKYCLHYSTILQQKADEICYCYAGDIAVLLDFLKEHQDYAQINVMIDEIDTLLIKAFNALHEHNINNVALCLTGAPENYDTSLLQSIALPFYFYSIATNWEQLHYYLHCGVSEIIIGEILGFYAKKAAEIAHSRNVKIRAYANVAQSYLNKDKSMTAFFIRPEDVRYYEGIIDTIEFWGELEKQSTFYKIYKSGKWLGPLDFIIIGLHSEVSNLAIINAFGAARVKCEKRCLQGRKCSLCANVQHIAKQKSSN